MFDKVAFKQEVGRLEAMMRSYEDKGVEASFERLPSPTDDDFQKAENHLNTIIPHLDLNIKIPQLVKDLLQVCSFNAKWDREVDEDGDVDEDFFEEFSPLWQGYGYWSLASLIQVEQDRLEFCDLVIKAPKSNLDRDWWNDKFSIYSFDGEHIALDLTQPETLPVVYLAHDGSYDSQMTISPSLYDFLINWIKLGCFDLAYIGHMIVGHFEKPLNADDTRIKPWLDWYNFKEV